MGVHRRASRLLYVGIKKKNSFIDMKKHQKDPKFLPPRHLLIKSHYNNKIPVRLNLDVGNVTFFPSGIYPLEVKRRRCAVSPCSLQFALETWALRHTSRQLTLLGLRCCSTSPLHYEAGNSVKVIQ